MSFSTRFGLEVDRQLADFVEREALPGTGVSADRFWDGLAALIVEVAARNRQLLALREDLQAKIDRWHHENGPVAADPGAYRAFLHQIGYLVAEPEDFAISPGTMDKEITTLCGPQLVVPVANARYALNAANARWGSLFDALYGSDAIGREGELAPAPGKKYNPERGQAVFSRAASFLDEAFALGSGSHADVIEYGVQTASGRAQLVIKTANGALALADQKAFAGYKRDGEIVTILLRHRGVHVELVVDRSSMIGASHKAGLSDVMLEAALSVIQDCEDSVAAVDADDKVGLYRNWLGLMKGDLADSFEKNGQQIERRLNPDRAYTAPDGSTLIVKGRALQLVRNVGHLMVTDLVLDAGGNAVGEGIIDAAVTGLCALHDVQKTEGVRNSVTGSIYIVKPKMHGPDEVALACDIFAGVEKMLGLDPKTIKIGIMDEERRTSANLKACIFEARERLFFINTGFLDRTGDEIHTSMRAGPVPPKARIKSEPWIIAYEDRNVLIGLGAGLSGKAQIGKGMWAMPDNMADMLAQKGAQPDQGANCAWVPSPTAATLHMLHYHQTDVFAAQKRRHNEKIPGLDVLFSLSTIDRGALGTAQIVRELENNAQGILGYVVRWIDQGVGCSTVPDINDVGLMEDRATLRISSQHIANWLLHGVVSRDEVEACFMRMAKVVDGQNAADALYEKMAGNFEHSIAFKAALELALEGVNQPSGYTEPILHRRRLEKKAAG